jgi:hypothetical protein
MTDLFYFEANTGLGLESISRAGLPDFFWVQIPKREKYTK